MNVVLQGFAGFVYLLPSVQKEPAVTVHDQGDWVGGLQTPRGGERSQSHRNGKTWYEESVKLFGAAGFYGGDLFHEGGNIPSNLDVSKYAGDIQKENDESKSRSSLGTPPLEIPDELVLKGLKKIRLW